MNRSTVEGKCENNVKKGIYLTALIYSFDSGKSEEGQPSLDVQVHSSLPEQSVSCLMTHCSTL